MKKIDIVTRAMSSGGAERVIAQLANFFVEQNVESRIITTEDCEVMYQLDRRIRVIPVGKKSDNKVLDRIARYSVIRNTVVSERPDVVLTMPEDTGIYVILALLGTGIPVYVSERNNPWVMPDSKITRLLRRIAYPFAKGIIFQTEMAKSFFSSRIQKKGVVLSNPVDASRIPFPHEGERDKRFVAVGRLETQKNFIMLIKAFADFCEKIEGYKLTIYGEGSERANLERLISGLGLVESVELPGRDKDVLRKINNATAFILSSDYEGLPNALIEAMCMGMPVISTDCPSGGPRLLIENENNGLLIPTGDQKALVNALLKCVDEKYAESLGKNAFNIRNRVTCKKIFFDWYKYLLGDKKDAYKKRTDN